MNIRDKIYLSVIGILLAIVITGAIYCNFFYERPDKEWRRYMSLTGKQLTTMWIDIFFDTAYKNGDKNLKSNDCSGAFYLFMNGLGAKLKLRNSWGYREILQQYGYKRRKFKDIRVGDIVTFYRDSKGIGHIGLVSKVCHKTKKYFILEHTKKSNGFDYTAYRWGNGRIAGVYMCSLSFFYGEKI